MSILCTLLMDLCTLLMDLRTLLIITHVPRCACPVCLQVCGEKLDYHAHVRPLIERFRALDEFNTGYLTHEVLIVISMHVHHNAARLTLPCTLLTTYYVL